MTTANCEVSCYCCHTVNSIRLGTNFYDEDTIYQCYNCGNTMLVKLRQEMLENTVGHQPQVGSEV